MKTVIEKLNEALTELEKETVSPIKTQTEQGIKNLIARAEGKIVGGKSHLPPILGVAMNVQKKTAATIAPGTEQAEKDAAEVEQLQKDVEANLTLEQKAFQAQIEKYVAAYSSLTPKQFQAALKAANTTIEAFADELLIDISSFKGLQKYEVCLQRLKVLSVK